MWMIFSCVICPPTTLALAARLTGRPNFDGEEIREEERSAGEMIENIKSMMITIHIQESDNTSCYWDQEWYMTWRDDLTPDLTKLVGNRKGPPHKTESLKSKIRNPQEFITLFRELADQIERQVDLAEEAEI